jgi:chromosome segregation ATPase
MDNSLLTKRLQMRESMISPRSVTQVAQKLHGSLSDQQASFDAFKEELHMYKSESLKVIHSLQLGNQDIKRYQEEERRISNDIEFHTTKIKALSEELEQQKKIRKHKESSEIAAKSVNELTARSVIDRSLDATNKDYARISEQVDMLDSKISGCSEQFQALVASVAKMQSALADKQ